MIDGIAEIVLRTACPKYCIAPVALLAIGDCSVVCLQEKSSEEPFIRASDADAAACLRYCCTTREDDKLNF